jgi:prevent-host-death family protein
MSDTLPFSEVKAHLSEVADRVEREHDRIVVTRNGRPSFVLLSPDDLASLEATLDILQDDELMESLRTSRKVRDAAIQAMLGPIAERPRRVGKPLVGELTGLYSARRGDYRVIHEIDDDRKVVIVHRVQHRRVGYRRR